eukprot:190036_1
MPTISEWVFVITLNTIQFLVCIVIIYYALRFYRFRHEQALQKRHPLLVYLLTIFSVLFIVQNQFYKLSFIYGVTDFDINALKQSKNDPYYGNLYLLISTIFYVFSLHGFSTVLVARSWIIYFDINRSIQIQKAKWSVHLNSNNNTSSFWFIKHYTNFGSGSTKYIYSIVIGYYLFVAILLMTLILSNVNIDDIISSILFVIVIILLTIIWNKIPAFHDVFVIQQEMRYVLRLSLTVLILYIIWTIKVIIVGYHLWSFMLFQFLFAIIIGFTGIIINAYIFNDKYKRLLGMESDDKTLQLTATDSIKSKYTLKYTLKNNELIEGFFKHLSDEFSIELLLGFIELTQFENKMLNDPLFINIMSNENEMKSMLDGVVLSNKLPKSKIVFETYKDMSGIQKYLLIAKELYNKYIINGSEFEINISWTCKQQIIHFIHNYCDKNDDIKLNDDEKYKLFRLYYEARETLYRLMQSSHNRFLMQNTEAIKMDHMMHDKNNMKTPKTPIKTQPHLSLSLIEIGVEQTDLN